jgi:hypothetical protein
LRPAAAAIAAAEPPDALSNRHLFRHFQANASYRTRTPYERLNWQACFDRYDTHNQTGFPRPPPPAAHPYQIAAMHPFRALRLLLPLCLLFCQISHAQSGRSSRQVEMGPRPPEHHLLNDRMDEAVRSRPRLDEDESPSGRIARRPRSRFFMRARREENSERNERAPEPRDDLPQPIEDVDDVDDSDSSGALSGGGGLTIDGEDQSFDAPPTPAATLPPLTPEMLRRRDRIRQCLAIYFERREHANRRSPWGVMHSLIGFGVDTEMYAHDGQRVNAIGWLCWNGSCRGQQLFYLDRGRLNTRQGPGVEGHRGQFLAMLAQSRVPLDYEIRVESRRFSIRDLVAYEQRTCRPNSELTFKLIGLVHYLDSDAEWRSDDGEQWNIQRLIKEELAQQVVGAACGGTHRMMGFSYAVNKRRKRGEAFTGQWKRAKKFVEDFQEYTLELQNDDGSFSTNWFVGRGAQDDIDRRLQTTGHILEWLVFTASPEELRDPRLVKSIDYLTALMSEHRNHTFEIGPRGHAVHALSLYDERVFEGNLGDRAADLAEAVERASRSR